MIFLYRRRVVHVEIPMISNVKDFSMIHRAICESNFFSSERVDSENTVSNCHTSSFVGQ